MPAKVNPDARARAVAAVLAGATVASVAREHGVSRQAVMKWRRRHTVEVDQAEIGALVLDYTRATFETLIQQAELAARPEWFMQQNARDVAMWGGVHLDKVVRLMAALQGAEG